MAAALGVAVRRIGYGVAIPQKCAALPEKTFRLIYVGRLVEEQKRISDVVAALCEAARRNPKLEAWIVGDGPARSTVERIIDKNGMGARVRLLGRIDNESIYDVLVQCHALVLLSDYEGLPIAMLEAMAAGVVPICLDMRSGIRETLQHGVNGMIVKDREEDFFAAVKALESNSHKWQQISVAARETIRQRHSIENCAQQWVDLLQRLDPGRTRRTTFKAPRMLQLPPANRKFGHHDLRLSWHRRLKDHAQARQRRLKNYARARVPATYEAIKIMLSTGRKLGDLCRKLPSRKNRFD